MEARFQARQAGEKGEIRQNLLKLLKISKRKLFFGGLALFGIAAVILFAGFGFDWAFASFGDTSEEQLLIAEEPSGVQFQEIERRVVQNGSYVYSSAVPGGQGYQLLIQANDSYEGLGGGEELSASILIQGSAFLAPANPYGYLNGVGIFGKGRSNTITYEVQAGDNPSYIAASFGISTNTLLWANNLNSGGLIRTGDKLIVLPTSGVLHEVKKGENLAKIVKNYKGNFDETIAYNGLPADGTISLGQKIIVPNGEKPVYYQPRVKIASYQGPYTGISRNFPWGQCTYYVAQKRYVFWSGHAKDWINNAAGLGLSVCRGHDCQPQPGSIISLAGDTWFIRRYGHVAYVESANDSSITFSEMNYAGLGVKSVRTISRHDSRIKGYIY